MQDSPGQEYPSVVMPSSEEINPIRSAMSPTLWRFFVCTWGRPEPIFYSSPTSGRILSQKNNYLKKVCALSVVKYCIQWQDMEAILNVH